MLHVQTWVISTICYGATVTGLLTQVINLSVTSYSHIRASRDSYITLRQLQQVAYWVGMPQAVAQYCTQCVVCHQAKLPTPTPAPMTNVPIGGPWQILAADILEVTISHLYNGYLLVIMDYFTKWTEPIPLRPECCIHISFI